MMKSMNKVYLSEKKNTALVSTDSDAVDRECDGGPMCPNCMTLDEAKAKCTGNSNIRGFTWKPRSRDEDAANTGLIHDTFITTDYKAVRRNKWASFVKDDLAEDICASVQLKARKSSGAEEDHEQLFISVFLNTLRVKARTVTQWNQTRLVKKQRPQTMAMRKAVPLMILGRALLKYKRNGAS
eukprot:TRINITY_DN1338_c0_g1_i3.p1 TRINITY_DN1338_c0_g1~~TRINITY_DN1338_c0_g1_i3.p1  ORF type:complete len:183 (+),score=49.73 TRINITY_DN1338_c0_g1_i3:346-894(+)